MNLPIHRTFPAILLLGTCLLTALWAQTSKEIASMTSIPIVNKSKMTWKIRQVPPAPKDPDGKMDLQNNNVKYEYRQALPTDSFLPLQPADTIPSVSYTLYWAPARNFLGQPAKGARRFQLCDSKTRYIATFEVRYPEGLVLVTEDNVKQPWYALRDSMFGINGLRINILKDQFVEPQAPAAGAKGN